MEERSYWLGFSLFSGIGPTKFAKLLTHFGSAENAWETEEGDLKDIIGGSLAQKFIDFRKKNSLEEYEDRLHKKQVSYLTLQDNNYPKLLRNVKNAPFVLFTKGRLEFNSLENQKPIAIVGTRKITGYGRQVTELLTRDLVAAGCVVVSGLALGVDATAHQTTIDEGGRTIAVLGCGVDCCTPRENESLYNSILESDGAIVSEYPLGQMPTKGSFPSRNRIIAGLSQGVIVTEGAEDSGALYTAQDAFANNRKVFAVPGPINSSLSNGPFKLIQQGAKLVASASDVIDELGIKNQELRKKRNIKGDTKEEQTIIDLLQNEPLHFDELIKRTKINSSQLGGMLSLMEMKGMVKGLDGGFFGLLA